MARTRTRARLTEREPDPNKRTNKRETEACRQRRKGKMEGKREGKREATRGKEREAHKKKKKKGRAGSSQPQPNACRPWARCCPWWQAAWSPLACCVPCIAVATAPEVGHAAACVTRVQGGQAHRAGVEVESWVPEGGAPKKFNSRSQAFFRCTFLLLSAPFWLFFYVSRCQRSDSPYLAPFSMISCCLPARLFFFFFLCASCSFPLVPSLASLLC